VIEFNADLINDLAQRRAVLFLGAGVSASAQTNGGGRLKQWAEFLTSAAAKLPRGKIKTVANQLIKDKNYLFASELIKANLGEKWPELLGNEFRQLAQPSDLHKALVSLDQRILVTTNFDTLLEDAWISLNSGNPVKTHHPVSISCIDASAFKMLRDDNDYIVKLHGDINDIDSIVFDTSTYQRNAYGNTYYKELLHSLLLTHTFLFVGFSMADPAISLMVEMFAHRFPDTRPHYILTGGPIRQEVRDLWKSLRKLYVIPYNKAENHRELITGLTELNENIQSRRAELIASQSLSTKPGSAHPPSTTES